jgi:gamma-resorcylate decarboxylase
VNHLGFKGALANGFSQIGTPENCVYYDAPQYLDFWSVVERLDVPFYLHPRNPIASWAQIYQGHPWLLGPTWAFGQETAVHALRLMASGLFDRSGNFRTQTLIDALLEVGSDRILFSTDWPFENVDHAANWFDTASISEAERLKIGRSNAVTLLDLDL